MSGPRVVGIGGTTRPGSSGEHLVRAVLAAREKRGAMTRMFGGAVRDCDEIVIGTPGDHGGVSGRVKNAIDRHADGRVVSAAGWRACGVTLQALRGIVHAMRGWPKPVGIALDSVEQIPFLAGAAR